MGLCLFECEAACSPLTLFVFLVSPQAHNMPIPGSDRMTADATNDTKNTCIDVCAEFTGTQDCQTRCVRNPADKKHACREACQVAFGAACDRAFPPSAEGGAQNYKICLQYLGASCEDTCKQFRG